MIKDTNVYLKDIMKKILNSYSIIDELSDKPNDLQLLKIELQKINGFLLVLSKRLYLINIDHSNKQNMFFVVLSKQLLRRRAASWCRAKKRLEYPAKLE